MRCSSEICGAVIIRACCRRVKSVPRAGVVYSGADYWRLGIPAAAMGLSRGECVLGLWGGMDLAGAGVSLVVRIGMWC